MSASLARRSAHAEALPVLEARRGLEREAARLAAERRTEADLAILGAILADQRAAADAADCAAFVRADVAFHRAVVVAADNPVLIDLLDHLGTALDAAIAVVLDEHQGTAEPFRVHTDIADAIRDRRAEDAATLADALIAASIALVRVGARDR